MSHQATGFFPKNYLYNFSVALLILDANTYWAGYFTSRSAFKLHERVNNGFLQAAKQLDANLDLGGKQDIMVLARALGAAQHHDAITGTARALVDDDYHQRLRYFSKLVYENEKCVQEAKPITVFSYTFYVSKGHHYAQNVMSHGIFEGLSDPPLDTDVLHTCPWLNVSSCAWTTDELMNSNILMSVYNPRPKTQEIYAR